ncbi:MAG: hypothetical protein Kow00129_02470 [Thermoleophilia bacterium]
MSSLRTLFEGDARRWEDSRLNLVVTLAGALVVLAVLTLARSHSYNLFHSIAEFFSVVVAITIFMIAWNTRRFLSNGYFLVLGGAYLSVGLIDGLHALAYRGMGVFEGFDTDLPTQLWLAARYLQVGALVAAPAIMGRRVRIEAVLAVSLTLMSLLLASILWWDVFPAAFVEGQGLTLFKIGSEYVISAALLGALVLTYLRRSQLERRVLSFMLAAIAVTIASELAFTLYTDPTGPANLAGHYFKIVAVFLTYKALVETALQQPYEVLFQDLKASERALRRSEARYKEIADSLQENLLDVPDSLPGVDFAHIYHSATRATRVGGDFYDIFALNGDRIGITVGDVSGKGLRAATTTALVKDTVRAYAFDGSPPAETMRKSNQALLRSLDDLNFVTAFFGVFDPKDSCLTYCSAGHPPGLVRRGDGTVEELNRFSPVLGAFPDVEYAEEQVVLGPDELILLYTDGVIEARRGPDFYGDSRLKTLLAKLEPARTFDVPAAVINDVIRFARGRLDDDVALLAFVPARADTAGRDTSGGTGETGADETQADYSLSGR